MTAGDPHSAPNPDGGVLLQVARRTLELHLTGHSLLAEPAPDPRLQEPGATFVTVKNGDTLRGCIGTLKAHRPLIEDLRSNTLAAATRDPRFPTVTARELPQLTLEISLLTPPVPLRFETEAQARDLLKPGTHGVVLTWHRHRSTFLPQVWQQLPSPERFLAELKHKAGLARDFWDPEIELAVYEVRKWVEGEK